MTKLSPSLPEGDRNGLGAISAALCDAPHSPHVRHGAAMLPYDTEKELTDLFTEVGLDKDSPDTEGGDES